MAHSVNGILNLPETPPHLVLEPFGGFRPQTRPEDDRVIGFPLEHLDWTHLRVHHVHRKQKQHVLVPVLEEVCLHRLVYVYLRQPVRMDAEFPVLRRDKEAAHPIHGRKEMCAGERETYIVDRHSHCRCSSYDMTLPSCLPSVAVGAILERMSSWALRFSSFSLL